MNIKLIDNTWQTIELVESTNYKGAYWSLECRATKTATAGTSKVEWRLWKGGRVYPNDSPTYLNTQINFTIKDGDTNLVSYGAEIKNNPQAPSYPQPHNSYQPKHNTQPTYSGDFEIAHEDDGKKTLSVSFLATFPSVNTEEHSVDIELPVNYPRTPCYWDNSGFVKTNKTFVAPSGKLEISWDGAKGGVSNAIKEFRVSYSVESNDGNTLSASITVDSDLNKTELTIPSNAQRGSTITITVGIIGESISDPVVKSITVYVNVRPDKPVITWYSGMETRNIFSYELSSIQFKRAPLTKTGKPASQPEQQLTLQIEVDNNEEWGAGIPSLNSWDGGTSKAFRFRVTDGEENSEESGPYNLTRNWDFSKSFSLAAKEGSSYIMTATLPTALAAPDTFTPYQSYSAIATLFNGENKLKSLPFSTSSDFDIRSLFLEDLKSSETYENLKVVLTCTDGVDETSTSIKDLSIEVPVIKITGTYTSDGQEKQWNYYWDGHPERVKLSSSHGTDWTYAGIDIVGPGGTLQRIKMRGSINYGEFYVKTVNSITAIKNLVLDFKLNGENIYKPYSSAPTFSSLIEDNTWEKYGLTETPSITFWFDESETVSVQATEASSNNTISYQFSGAEVYDIANTTLGYKTGDKKTLWYSYTNVYGTDVTQTATTKIELDYRETAKIANNGDTWDICANPDGDWNSVYAIENWNCIKEGMPLSTNIEIAATTKPTAWLERGSGTKGWTKFYEFNVTEKKNSEVTVTNNKFNTSTPTYVLTSDDGIGEISQGADNDQIRLVVKTDSTSNLESIYKNETFIFARHVAPLAKFTSVSYSNNIIKGKYAILDSGTNMDEYEQEWELKIEGANGLISENETQYEFSYTFGDSTYIYVAPVLTTTLSASIIIKGKEETAFETDKTTDASTYEYIICYNISPTVAYRSNYLGINTKTPQNDAILDINAYQEHSLIYLRGSGHCAAVDLVSGALINFIVDCGSWDNTPGGIVPGGDVPIGLAKVAYTGEFSDLEQQDNTVEIILDAN